MDLREIIVWLGMVAIAVILWDGLRRMKLGKQKPKTEDEKYEDPEDRVRKAQIARELPNGGARIREMTDHEQDDLKSRLNLRERVPMLMERVAIEDSDDDSDYPSDASIQSELDFTLAMAEPIADAPSKDDGPVIQPVDDMIEVAEITDNSSVEEDLASEPDEADVENTQSYESDLVDEIAPSNSDEIQTEAAVEFENLKTEVSEDKVPEKRIDPGPVEDLVVIHVMAKNEGELSGSRVLELLLTAGLRHGPMDIFHYRNPQGYTEFSLANCVQPGIFDPDSMNQVNTPGVTLFMQLPTASDAMESFEHMHEMARYLASNLEAEILDEDHSSVTPQRLEYYREKLRTFARSKLIPS